jgi:hypothetical protein
MAGEIFVDPNSSGAGAAVVMVDGVCYQLVGPSDQPPSSMSSVQGSFGSCDECASSSSSSSSAVPATCCLCGSCCFSSNSTINLTIAISAESDGGAAPISVINCSNLTLSWSYLTDGDGNCIAQWVGSGGTSFTVDGTTYQPYYVVTCFAGIIGLVEIYFGSHVLGEQSPPSSYSSNGCCGSICNFNGTVNWYTSDDDGEFMTGINISGYVTAEVANNQCCQDETGDCVMGAQNCDGQCVGDGP